MSLCMLLQRKNEIYMAGESRVSIDINGKNYRWNDNYSKIEQIDNFVIFKSGSAEVMNNIINRFRGKSSKDISSFQKISIEEYMKYKDKLQDDFKPFSKTKKMIVAGLIGTFEGDKPVVYFISDATEFKIVRVDMPEDKDVYEQFLGVKLNEATAIYKTCEFDFNNFENVFENYQKIYSGVVGTDIGGTLKVFCIKKDSIVSNSCGLKNPEYIDELSDYLLKTYFKKLGENSFGFSSGLLKASDFQDANGNSMMTNGKFKAGYVDMTGVTLAWGQITGTPSYITSTKITSTTIESPTITGATITGGTITSDTTINVGTDATIGAHLNLSPSNYGNGILWGNVASIFIDPASETLFLGANNGVQVSGLKDGSAIPYANQNYSYNKTQSDSKYIGIGTGSSKTISFISAGDTEIFIRFTDGTTKSINYTS